MKIAILTPTFNYYSGIDRVVQLQAEDYTKKGHEVTIIALDGDITPEGYKLMKLGMIKNLFLQRLYRLFFFLDAIKMMYYRKLKEYDIVISHFYPMNLLACIAKWRYKKIKYIYHNHGMPLEFKEVDNNLFYYLYMKLFFFLSTLTLFNVDKINCVSKYVKDICLKKEVKYRKNIKVNVVYNKIDKKRFNINVNGEYIRKKWNINNEKVYLYVGRLAPHKGISLLLEMFKDTKKRESNTKLIIVGVPTYDSYYRELRENADKDVIFAGYVDDRELPSYYGACDVYVTASSWECYNLPVAEAQVCGKPVIAFDIGSHKEVVKKGTLIPEGDLDRFTNSMIRYVKSV